MPPQAPHSGSTTQLPASARLHSVHSARLATLLELLESGVGIEIGVIGGSPSLVVPGGWRFDETTQKEGKAEDEDPIPFGAPFRAYNLYHAYFVEWLNRRFPVRALSPKNIAHRNLTEHRVWNVAMGGARSDWSSFCTASQFHVDRMEDEIEFSHPRTTFPGTSSSTSSMPWFPARIPDLLLIEFAINDFHTSHPPVDEFLSLHPTATYERLFRGILSHPELSTAMMTIEYAYNVVNFEEPGAFPRNLEFAPDGSPRNLGLSAEPEHRVAAEHYGVPMVSWTRGLLRHELMRLPDHLGSFLFGAKNWPLVDLDPPNVVDGFLKRLLGMRIADYGKSTRLRLDHVHVNAVGHAVMCLLMQTKLEALMAAYLQNDRKSLVDLSFFAADERAAILSGWSTPILPEQNLGAPTSPPMYTLAQPMFAWSTIADWRSIAEFPSCRLLHVPYLNGNDGSREKGFDATLEANPMLGIIASQSKGWTYGLNHVKYERKRSYRPSAYPPLSAFVPEPSELDHQVQPGELVMRLPKGLVSQYVIAVFVRAPGMNRLGVAKAWLSCGPHPWANEAGRGRGLMMEPDVNCITRSCPVLMNGTWLVGATESVLQPVYVNPEYVKDIAMGAGSARAASHSTNQGAAQGPSAFSTSPGVRISDEDVYKSLDSMGHMPNGGEGCHTVTTPQGNRKVRSSPAGVCCEKFSHLHIAMHSPGSFHFVGYTYR